MTTSLETFLLLSPEITLFLAALIAYLAAAFSGLRAGWLVAVTGLGIAILVSGSQPDSGQLFHQAQSQLMDSRSTYASLPTPRDWYLRLFSLGIIGRQQFKMTAVNTGDVVQVKKLVLF